MSDEVRPESAVPLARPARQRPSWRRKFAGLAVLVGLCAVIIGRCSDIALLDCASVARSGVWAAAVHLCQFEFQRTKDPRTGIRLADALRATGDLPAAKRVATGLLPTPAQSDALQILGQIALDEDRLEEAVTVLEHARKLHRAEKRRNELVRDDGLLASVRTKRSEFAEALQLLDECITEAQLDDDKPMQCHCHLVAAQTLIRVGYFKAANEELDIAIPLATSDDERIDLAYQRANQAQEADNHATAIVRFADALARGKDSRENEWIINTELNLAYSLGELGQFDEALRHLENATRLDTGRKKESVRAWTAAQIAYRQHDLTRASSQTDLYFNVRGAETEDDKHADSYDRDTRVDVATLRARIELDRNDLASAASWAQRAIDEVELIRRAQSALELRSWVLAKRRAAYELRFIALARNHRVEEAAMAFDEWQGRSVQDVLATSPPLASLDRRGIADHVTRLGNWLPAVSQARFAGRPDREAVLRTMHRIDLLALIVANGDVWRLTANHGPPQLSRLPRLAVIQDLVERFRDPRTDAQLASALGELLVPDDVFRETPDVLHVIVDTQLGGLPVAALQHKGTPLVALRPIVHLLRLPDIHCVHVARSGPATVLAGPDGGNPIPKARIEAEQVAALLHTTSKSGSAATTAALFAASKDAVLHVAAHSKLGIDGAAIVLADGEVPAPKIPASGLAPSLAVLSTCGAATSNDPELAGSLAAGFLAAGSQHVLATQRSVSDADALDVIMGFYGEGGVTDPARALAAAQRALWKTGNNRDWPYFAVFGPDVCPENAPDDR